MPQTASLLTMPRSKRSTHVRVTTDLAARLNRLRDEMQAAYSLGRLDVPGEYAEHIPIHYVIETALNEVEARRSRSNRPRPAKPPSQPQDQEFRP
jgi:hypothetical protein